jgi:hypothetical protein
MLVPLPLLLLLLAVENQVENREEFADVQLCRQLQEAVSGSVVVANESEHHPIG